MSEPIFPETSTTNETTFTGTPATSEITGQVSTTPAKSALLSLEEFLVIRERRSQDDLKALIAHIEELFGIAPPVPAAQTVVVTTEPQTTVVVAPDTAPPAIPADAPSATQPAPPAEPFAVEPVPPTDPNVTA